MYGIEYSKSKYFNISKEQQAQAIKNAQESWNTKEVKESLERSRQKCKILLEQEQEKDNERFAIYRVKVAEWLHSHSDLSFIIPTSCLRENKAKAKNGK